MQKLLARGRQLLGRLRDVVRSGQFECGEPFEYDACHTLDAANAGTFPIEIPKDGLVSEIQWGVRRDTTVKNGPMDAWVSKIQHGAGIAYQNASGVPPISGNIRVAALGLMQPMMSQGYLRPLVVREGGVFLVSWQNDDATYDYLLQVHVCQYEIPAFVNDLLKKGIW